MRDQTRSTDGTTIRWSVLGTGPPLVLVPGGLGGENAFAPLVNLLSERLCCVTMGRRGKGFSGDGPAYSFEREYEDVAAVLDVVGPPRFVFGQSSGAICALGAALLTQVDRLVLVEPPLPLAGPVISADQLAAVQDALERDGSEAALLIALRDAIQMDPAAIERRRAGSGWQGEVERAPAWLRELPEINRLPADVERYRAITAPTLLIYGTATQEHHRRAVEALGNAMPHARVAAFEGFGHDVANAAADQVAAAVLDLLDG